MKDFIPDSHANRLAWLINLKTELLAIAATLGWNAAKTTAANAILYPLIAIYQTLVDAESTAAQASLNADELYADKNTDLRDLINEVKNNAAFTEGMGEALKILTNGNKPDPADIQPRIDAEVLPGQVRITGSKDYAELYNLYTRVVGSPVWGLIGIRRKKFPFDDQTPLKVPGVFEEREYYARGVINDEEIGLPSDIVSVKFAG